MRALLILLSILISTTVYAVELVNEQFASNINGWSVSSSSKVYHSSSYSGSMFIDSKDKGWKTYSFGSSYANQTLSVEVSWCATNQWESNNDYLRVKVNGGTAKKDYDGGGCQNTTFNADADSSGDFKIEFSPRTSSNNEDAYIKWFTVNGTPSNADLSITKTVDNATPTVGEQVTFTIIGTNNGSTTTDISITDTLPAGLSWVSDSENKSSFYCTNVGNAVTCTGSQNFSPNESVVINIVARVDSAGTIVNSANIVSTQGVPDSDNSNNSSSVTLTATPPNADLSITKTVDNATPTVGDLVTFTIVGTNNGSTTTDISITDTLPAGLSWVSDSENKSSFYCTNVGNAVTCTGSQNFSPNESVVINIVARVDSAGTIVNSANIVSTQGVADNDNSNNSASVTITAQVNTLITCPGDVIANLDGTSVSATDSDSGTISPYTTYYYNFTPVVDGTIQVDSSVGASYNSLFIKDGCGSNLWANENNGINKSSPDINVLAGQQIVVALERRYSTSKTYSIDFTFTYIGPIPPTMGNVPNQSVAVNTPFTLDISSYTTETNGDPILSYSLTGSLPSGLSFNSSTGIISGTTPSTISSTSFSVTATDKDGVSNSDTFSISVTDILPSSGEREFTLYRQSNIIGDMKIIGNSVKIDSANGGQCAPNGTNNNSITATYADMDSDSSTFNSTSANLVLPANVKSSNIEYALLNWQGRTGSSSNSLTYGTAVKVKPFGQTNYQTITTISSKFNRISRDYQGIQDITAVIKQSIDDVNQTVIETSGYDKPFWVADVYAPDNSNGYGVWSLVVVYRDEAAKLRNISVYDGFKSVYNETITTNLSGFITPSSGTVSSKFFVFAGEGDITLTDSVSLTNVNGTDTSLGSNIFKSSIDDDGVNITNRSPSCQNTIGADVRSFSVGTNGSVPIIGNSQTSTNIKLTSTGDEYLPGLFAFSTDLYEPRVCYKQEFADENGDPLGSISVGDTITVKTWISNMKKDAADGNLEPASQVEVELEFDSDNLEYISNSTIMKNIGENNYTSYNDTNQTGLADYFTDTNSSNWRVGVGASSTDGGLINPNASGDDSLKAFVELKTKLLQDGDITVQNIYKVSYLNTQLNLYFGHIPMAECADINSSLGVAGIAGAFNVVSTSFSGATDPVDGTDSLNALHTQVSSKPFTVRVLSLGSDNITLKSYTGDVNVSIINTPAFISGDDAGNQILCDNATSINSPQTVTFNGTNNEDLNVTNITTATKSASFKIGYFAGSTQKYACSRDVFAIRPYSFKTFGKNQYKRAGEDFNITVMAVDEGNDSISSGKINDPSFANAVNGVSGYNANLSDLNITSKFYQPTSSEIGQMQSDTGETVVATCPNPGTFTINNPLPSFANGEVTASLKFSETGILDLNISEKQGSEWAIVDTIDTGDAQRYIKPSTQSFDETDISKNTILAFIPYKFDTTATYETTNGENWLYMSDINKSNSTFTTPQMAAYVEYNITAKNKDNATLLNYTATCFPDTKPTAPTVNGLKLNTTFDLLTDATLNTTRGANISIYAENNVSTNQWVPFTNQTLTTGNNQIQGSIDPYSFQSGVAQAFLYFNIDRNVSNAINPVKITLNDANTSTSWMANAGATNIFNGVTPNSNKTFLYARTHAPRSRFKDDNGTAFIYYEVFCDGAGCDKTLLPDGSGSNYTDDPRWFRNTLHTSVSGNVGSVTQKGGAGVVTAGTLNNTAGTTEVPLTYDRTKGFPYKTTMENNASSWLIYNKYDSNAKANEFEVEFQGGSTGWAGEHETNTTTKRGGTDRTNRRSMW